MTTLGFVHTIYVSPGIVTDVVPVDMVTNSLLTAIWDYVVNRNEPQVYNYGSSDWNPLRFFAIKSGYVEAIHKRPSSKMVWYPFLIFTANTYLFLTLHVLFHVFPATVADAVLMIQRKEPKMLEMVYQATKQFRMLNYFTSTSWIIKTDKLKSIMNSMDSIDLEEFSFDITLMDWHDYTEIAAINVRRLLDDPMDTVPYARKKLRKFKMLHCATLTLLFTLAFFFLYRILYSIIDTSIKSL